MFSQEGTSLRIIRSPTGNFETPSKPEYRAPKPEYSGAQISLVPGPDRGYIGIQRLGTVLDVRTRPGSSPASSRKMTGRAFISM